MKKTIIAMTLSALMLVPITTLAGDPTQQWLIQRAQEAKMKLKAAEQAKGEERQKMMHEHMTMMNEMMDKMHVMKPSAGMAMKEHEEWMAEHQKIMEDMMAQMMSEHHLMMQSPCK